MKTFMSFRCITESSYHCSKKQIKNMDLVNYSVSRGFKPPKVLAGFPNIDTLWPNYVCIKLNEITFKKALFDQFVTESQINKPKQPFNVLERILIMRSSIRKLIEHNLVSSVNSVIDGLLAVLQPFPFDRSKLLNKDQNDITVKDIRNEVEKQYLAWCFKVDLQEMSEILNRYGLCLYEFRSMENLKKNIDMLKKLPRVSKLSVAEKIYHLNQKPFNIKSIQFFENTIAGVNWQLFPNICPKLLSHSHQYIMFLVSMLRDLNFTEKQIQHGLPFLHYVFYKIIQRLGNMLSNPEIAKYRDEIKFLELLSFQKQTIEHMINVRKASFSELTEIINISSKNFAQSYRSGDTRSILYHIHQFYELNFSCLENIKRHPQYKLVSENQIQDTLRFLHSKGFKAKEVEESITIILYPRKSIENALAKIDSEAETLLKYGFKNGCLGSETNFFEKGTKEKQKVLQLCLYYMEKPHNFSGDGIWGECEITPDC